MILQINQSFAINPDLVAYCEFTKGNSNAQYELQQQDSLTITFSGAEKQTLYGELASKVWNQLNSGR